MPLQQPPEQGAEGDLRYCLPDFDDGESSADMKCACLQLLCQYYDSALTSCLVKVLSRCDNTTEPITLKVYLPIPSYVRAK